ncbi:hypothetical protein [Flavobacterium sp.]|uniref:hypothetical protein n=2 Tax=Flavobacterium sp. TaxID=239 RepID=UPI004047DF3B
MKQHFKNLKSSIYSLSKTSLLVFAWLTVMLILSSKVNAQATFPIKLKYKITSYSITLSNSVDKKEGFGWIELKDGNNIVGNIYFQSKSEDDRFGGGDANRPLYIVMHQPLSMWNTILEILRNEKSVFIRAYQADANSPVNTFIETSSN